MREIFESEYDLQSLELIQPKGHELSMFVTPRFRDHYVVRDYEKMTASFLVRQLSRADLFIDVGAHYGFFSLLAGAAHPSLPIIALEPMPVNYDILRRNIAFGRHSHIDARQVAASAAPGTMPDFLVSAASDNCGFYENPNAPTIGRIEVETVPIDALIADRGAHKVVVKINTDGYELAVLAGMTESLRRGLDIRLVIEFNPKMQRQAGHEPEALLQELDRLGFAMFVIDDVVGRFFRLRPGDDWRSLVGQTGYTNIYCVAKGRALSIVFFAHSSQLAGAERSLLELVDELVADYGAVCTVLAPGPGPLVERLSRLGAASILADLPWWAFAADFPRDEVRRTLVRGSQAVCRDVLPLLAAIDPDVVYTQTLVIPWGAVAASILGKPHVWSVCEYGERDHGFRFIDGFKDAIEAIKHGSSLILTANEDIRHVLFEDVSPDRIQKVYRHIPMPGDVMPSSAAWRRDGAIKLGLFGSVGEGKGQHEAVRAVAGLVRGGRDVELLLAGYVADESYSAKLKSLIESLGLNDRVTFAGFLSDPLSAIAACDVVLSCSRSEAFGRSVVEAMLLERPVVYARSGGFVEYMEDRTTGLAYTPGNVDELVRCIEEMIEDRPSAARMGQAAKRSAQQRFSRDAYGGAAFQLLMRLREKKRHVVNVPRCILVSMATAISEDGAAIAEHVAVLARRNAEVSDLRNRIAAMEADAAELQVTMGALKKSTSWRITAPLRMARTIFNRTRRRNE